MTPRTSRLLPLIPAILAFTTLATLTTRANAQPPAPCTLLTPTQIKTVLTTPLSEGKPGTPTAGTTDCTWSDPKGVTRVYLSLNDPGYGYKSFRDSMLATGKLVPIPGLAEDAFFISSPGNSAALYALKNKHLLLITVDGPNFTKIQNESAEQTLATAILPKL
jgi:hypothetical protein